MLKEAEALGSVSEACRRAGITRQTFYRWRRHFEASGLGGLQDRPMPSVVGRPKTMTLAKRQILLDHIRRNPMDGCAQLARWLGEIGIQVSSPTIQKTLIKWRLGSQVARNAWVQEGCPFREPATPPPDEGLMPVATLGCARSFYFLGIPKTAWGRGERLFPSSVELAEVLGTSTAILQRMIKEEHWADIRARFLLLAEASRPSAGDQAPTTKTGDSSLLTFAAREVNQLQKFLNGNPQLGPSGLRDLNSVLYASYKEFRAALGEVSPILRKPSAPSGFLLKDVHFRRPLPSRTDGRGLSLSEVKGARRLFFTGIPSIDGNTIHLSPTVRAVAEHLGFFVPPLQQVAVRQDWVRARRNADRRLMDFHQQAFTLRIGRDRVLKLHGSFESTAYKLALIGETVFDLLPDTDLHQWGMVSLACSRTYIEIHSDLRWLWGLS